MRSNLNRQVTAPRTRAAAPLSRADYARFERRALRSALARAEKKLDDIEDPRRALGEIGDRLRAAELRARRLRDQAWDARNHDLARRYDRVARHARDELLRLGGVAERMNPPHRMSSIHFPIVG